MAKNADGEARFVVDDVLDVQLILLHPVRLNDDQGATFATRIRDTFDAESVRYDDDSIYIRSIGIYIDLEDERTEFRLAYPTSKERLHDLAYAFAQYCTIAKLDPSQSFAQTIEMVYKPSGEVPAPVYLGEKLLAAIDLDDLDITSVGAYSVSSMFSRNDESIIIRLTPRFHDPTMTRVHFPLMAAT